MLKQDHEVIKYDNYRYIDSIKNEFSSNIVIQLQSPMTTRFIFVMVCFCVTCCSNWCFFKHSSAPYQHCSLDCAISTEDHSNIQKPFTTKTWYVGRVYIMGQKVGKYGQNIENLLYIDILVHPLRTKIAQFCWYRKSNGKSKHGLMT